ncbi:MAG: hypothetical protein DSM106950_39555 [Stigonema ocellatum SAG 48.90 = DSM 106950]|nr:hypothetical protein [Stigonema ocellatum SAG 48.90 = DSM 106950]
MDNQRNSSNVELARSTNVLINRLARELRSRSPIVLGHFPSISNFRQGVFSSSSKGTAIALMKI